MPGVPVVIIGELITQSPGVPTHPIVIPPDQPSQPPGIWGGGNVPMPSPPIAGVPGAPGFQPPSPGVPTHPIYYPPQVSHPIYLPPQIQHPIVIPLPPDSSFHPEHPIVIPPSDAHPEHPIVIVPPPPTDGLDPSGAKPPPADGGWGYHPVYGWMYAPAPGQPSPK